VAPAVLVPKGTFVNRPAITAQGLGHWLSFARIQGKERVKNLHVDCRQGRPIYFNEPGQQLKSIW